MYRLICSLLILFACFYGIGSYPLLDDNEGLYASIARDMLSNHQWIIPHLNGLPYLEKPPMLYWLMAASMSHFGVNEFAVRFIPALALFATACICGRLIFRTTQSEPAGFITALIMVTSLPLLAMGRMILCDMIMTCFLSAALIQCYEWYMDNRPRHLLGLYGFLALSVLTKGFVTIILAGGCITVFLIWQRTSYQQYRRLISPAGIALFLVIAAPWHIAATMQEPGFAWFYFINEHILRFLNMREPHDYYTGPLWYYLPRLLGYVLPWSLFMLLFFYSPRKVASEFPAFAKLLWSWFLFFLLFFSISGGKANYYMVAGTPALVMLLALQLRYHSEANPKTIRILCSASLLLIINALWIIKSFCIESSSDLYSTCKVVSEPTIMTAVFYAAIALILCWRVPSRWLGPLLGSNIILLLPLLISGVNMASERNSQKAVAVFLNNKGYQQVAMYQEFEELSAMAFYIKTPLVMVDSKSNDLLYGQKHAPTSPVFQPITQWAAESSRPPLVILNQRIDGFFNELYANHMDIKHICIIKRFERVSILATCA